MSIEVAIKKSFPNMFRPLKWMHFDSATEYGKGEWFAHGARGTFHIYDVREKFPNDRPFYAKEISDQFDTLEQAQAACQARNEGDIFIGLSPDFISEIDRLQRENASLREDRYKLACAITGGEDAPGLLDSTPTSEIIEIAQHAHRMHQGDIDRAMAAEAEVERLQTELALSKPLYSRRQIEARVKLLEAALKPFADLAECYDPDENDGDLKCWHDGSIPKIKDLRRARNALVSTGGQHHGN